MKAIIAFLIVALPVAWLLQQPGWTAPALIAGGLAWLLVWGLLALIAALVDLGLGRLTRSAPGANRSNTRPPRAPKRRAR
jgi:hypothetical protein